MTPLYIKKSFKGSQNGHDHHWFEAGTTTHLSDDLAAIVVKQGWAEPVGAPGMDRETKVLKPEETKSANPEATIADVIDDAPSDETKPYEGMTFKELKEAAKTRDIKTFGMSQQKLLAALQA
jgi:hypothetical protein